LLTDISIDWSNLPVTDVYPKRIPDLFGVKPVILSGRYSSGAKGTIRLKGKRPVRILFAIFLSNCPKQKPITTCWRRSGAVADRRSHA
jgi:Ca-activated chloride channel family protein